MLHYVISLGSAWLQIAHCNFVTKQNWKRWSLSWPEVEHFLTDDKTLICIQENNLTSLFSEGPLRLQLWPSAADFLASFSVCIFWRKRIWDFVPFFFIYFFSGDFQSLTETQKMKVEWGRDWLGLRQRLRKRKRVRVREWEWRKKNESIVTFQKVTY